MKKFIVCVVLAMCASVMSLDTSKPCKMVQKKYGGVCVCDENYCDTLDIPDVNANEYILVTSSKEGDRFSYERGTLGPDNLSNSAFLEINSSKVYQTIRGFGGGYTGSVTYLVDNLSANMQKYLFESYFSESIGMNYTYLRIPIGGTDFDLTPWAYNEAPENDLTLSSFKQLDDRDLQRNSQLKRLAKISKNENVKYLAAAWSPPKWMKGIKSWVGTAFNQLKSKYYQTWADYHLRWLELMAEDNVNFWGISTGNEPKAAAINFMFEEMYWNSDNHAKWISENFVPTIKNSSFSNIQIHGFDDSRIFSSWFNAMEKSTEKPLEHLNGFDFHGYSDFLSPKIMDDIQAKYPDKEIWYTEKSFGIGFVDLLMGGPRLGLWDRAEKLTQTLIEVLSHSTVGYFDWNIILDEKGGPNNAKGGKGYTDAPIILNSNLTEMYKQPMFYSLAHFSKFIPAGSVRIDSKLNGKSDVKTVTFLRPDNKIAAILFNNAKKSAPLMIMDKSRGTINIELKPKSINTLIYDIQ